MPSTHARRKAFIARWRWPSARDLTAVLLPLPMIFLAWNLGAAWELLTGLLLVEAVLIGWAFWPWGRVPLVGPLLGYDLARYARRGRTALLRVVYGLALLVCLTLILNRRVPNYIWPLKEAFTSRATISIRAWRDFGVKFVTAVTILQGLVAMFITPAYVAAAIAEERERDTLEQVLMTPLSDREIVLGKLFARLAHIGNVLLTGLPILLLTQFGGGVDSQLLFAGTTMTALTLLSAGGLSIVCSCLANTVLGATMSSYMLVTLFGAVCLAFPSWSPITFLNNFEQEYRSQLEEWNQEVESLQPMSGPRLAPAALGIGPPPNPGTILWLSLGGAAVPHFVVFAVSTWIAVSTLRLAPPEPVRARPMIKELPTTAGWGPFEEPEPIKSRPTRYLGPSRWPVTEQALLWKEAYHGTYAPERASKRNYSFPWGRWISLLAVAVPLGTAVLYLLDTRFTLGAVTVLNYVLRAVVITASAIWCVAVGFRVAGCITRERDHRTLECLFLLPVERATLLRAKWIGSVWRYRQCGVAIAGACFVGLLSSAFHPWSVILLVGSALAYLTFITSLGLWLSLASRNTLWANMTMALLLLLLLFAGSWLRSNLDLFSPDRRLDWQQLMLKNGLNPLRAWWIAGFTWEDLTTAIRVGDAELGWSLAGIAASIPLVTLAAFYFWLLARRRFRQEVERQGQR